MDSLIHLGLLSLSWIRWKGGDNNTRTLIQADKETYQLSHLYNLLIQRVPSKGDVTVTISWPVSAVSQVYEIILIGCEMSLGRIVSGLSQNKAVLEPRVSPAFAITYFCNHCNIRFENTSKYVDTLTLFSKNLNQRSLTPRWPLTPCLLRSHVWLYPRIIVSKSHGNTSMYVDTVINFANYHIHIHTYYVQNEWSHSLLLNSVQARQKHGWLYLILTISNCSWHSGYSLCSMTYPLTII